MKKKPKPAYKSYPILFYAILVYIMYRMLPYAAYDILRHLAFGPNPIKSTSNQGTTPTNAVQQRCNV